MTSIVLSALLVAFIFGLLFIIRKQREMIHHLRDANKISKSDARLVRRKDIV